MMVFTRITADTARIAVSEPAWFLESNRLLPEEVMEQFVRLDERIWAVGARVLTPQQILDRLGDRFELVGRPYEAVGAIRLFVAGTAGLHQGDGKGRDLVLHNVGLVFKVFQPSVDVVPFLQLPVGVFL